MQLGLTECAKGVMSTVYLFKASSWSCRCNVNNRNTHVHPVLFTQLTLKTKLLICLSTLVAKGLPISLKSFFLGLSGQFPPTTTTPHSSPHHPRASQQVPPRTHRPHRPFATTEKNTSYTLMCSHLAAVSPHTHTATSPANKVAVG